METLLILLTALTMTVMSSIGWASAEYIARPESNELKGNELQNSQLNINDGLRTESTIRTIITVVESAFSLAENEFKEAWNLNNEEQRTSYYTKENLSRFIQGGKITEYTYNPSDTQTTLKFVDSSNIDYVFTVYTDSYGVTKLEYKNGNKVITSDDPVGDQNTMNPDGV